MHLATQTETGAQDAYLYSEGCELDNSELEELQVRSDLTDCREAGGPERKGDRGHRRCRCKTKSERTRHERVAERKMSDRAAGGGGARQRESEGSSQSTNSLSRGAQPEAVSKRAETVNTRCLRQQRQTWLNLVSRRQSCAAVVHCSLPLPLSRLFCPHQPREHIITRAAMSIARPRNYLLINSRNHAINYAQPAPR